jgi:hypothetical protein
MKAIYHLTYKSVIISLMMVIVSCQPEETQIPVLPDCMDAIQNQGETGIDCGGPCDPCPSVMSAKVDGTDWHSAGSVNSLVNDSSIIILAGNGSSTLSLIYTGPFTNGTYNLDAASYVLTATNTNYLSSSGTITFQSWNFESKEVAGTFSFKAFDASGSGDTVNVTNGQFNYVPFDL